jgi:hypothetical protein
MATFMFGTRRWWCPPSYVRLSWQAQACLCVIDGSRKADGCDERRVLPGERKSRFHPHERSFYPAVREKLVCAL